MNNQDNTRQLIHTYRATRIKITKTSHHISFNQQCLTQNITPKYAKIYIRNTTYPAQKTKTTAERTYIQNSIKHLHHIKNQHNIKAYKLHLQLAQTLHHTQLEEVVTHTNTILTQISRKIRRRHQNKITSLKQQQTTTYHTKHKFHPRIFNTTNITFNHDETKLLEKGLKHNLQPNTKTKLQTIINTETAIQNTQHQHQEYIRQDIIRNMNNEHKTHDKQTRTQNNTQPKSQTRRT